MPFSEAVVPGNVLDVLVGNMATRAGAQAIEDWRPNGVVHLGDPFGRVLVWLWQTDRRIQAGIFFADLVARSACTTRTPPERSPWTPCSTGSRSRCRA